MRRLISFLSIYCLAAACFAQTQQGVVKTKGRMVKGKHVAGQGLSGATVTIQGGNSYNVQNANGSFSFPVPAKTFMVQDVQKKGYQLVDADATKKSYQYSENPLFLVMETPEQLQADRIAAERTLRRTLHQQLQKQEEEIDALKVSIQEKNRLLAELYKKQESNDLLIADIAKEYAQMDYDQMDSLNQRISDAILKGELTEAASLLKAKGDINARINSLRKEQQAEAEEKAELSRRSSQLSLSTIATQKKLEDIAIDCYKLCELSLMKYQLDSAAYYLTLRAELDTTNADWQFLAAYRHQDHHVRKKYYDRVIRLTQDNLNGYNLFLYSTTFNNIAAYCASIKDFVNAEKFYKKAIYGRRMYAEQSNNPNEWNHVAWTMVALCSMYNEIKRHEDAFNYLQEATAIYERIAPTYYENNEFYYGRLYDQWGWYYLQTKDYEKADNSYLKAWKYFLISTKERTPEMFALGEMNRLLVWGISNTYNQLHKMDEVENFYLELKKLYQKYIHINPKKLEPEYANLLFNLSAYYNELNNLKMEEDALKEALKSYRRLAKANPQKYSPRVAQTLGNLSYLKLTMNEYTKSEQYAEEGLAADSTQHWMVGNLAIALLFQGKYEKAEMVCRQYKDELKDGFLDDLKQFGETRVKPKEWEADVEKIRQVINE